MLDFIRPQKRFPLAVTRHALRGGAALRVAHLTDLHLEDGANAAWLKRLVRIVNAQHPDIICFTGDFACRRAQFARRMCIAAFCAACAPGMENLPSRATTTFWAQRGRRRS